MKVLLVIVAFIVSLGAAFFWFNNYIYEQKQGDGLPQEPIRVSLEGEYVCLPQKENTVATADCAIGLLTIAGDYYALDFGLMSQTPPQFVEGDLLSASGVMTPLEALSTDYWQKYPVVGIFSITDSLQKLEEEVVEPMPTATSTLYGSWNWRYTERRDATRRLAPEGDTYVLALATPTSYTSTTDCNSLGGTFVVDGEVLSFGPAVSTKMYCEGSEEGEYARELTLVTSYTIVNGVLHLQLNRDYGTMVFEPVSNLPGESEPAFSI